MSRGVVALSAVVVMASVFQFYRAFVSTTLAPTSGPRAATAWITINSASNARALARKIVESRLAACVNIVPKVTSIYEWKGNIEEDEEYLLIAKTKADATWKKAFVEFVEKNHPYDLPECIFTDVDGSDRYINWIIQNTK